MNPDLSNPVRRMAIVDASNVANAAPSARARLSYLHLIVARLRAAGLGVVMVADASLERRIDDRAGYQDLVATGAIVVAPPATDADRIILGLAREHDALVVSNDRFRQWQEEYPAEIARRHGFRVRGGVAEIRGVTD